VELAQIEYDVQQRGEGEKQLEVDRCLLRRQKDALEEELEKVRTHRHLHRERRKNAGVPVVALVGYTNAGESTLLAAFRATLEEVAEADLPVHVVDTSSPSMNRQIETVEQVLEEIGAGGCPVVVALNKTDLLACDAPLQLPSTAALPAIRVSALQGSGIDDLLSCISENLVLQFVALDVLIPYDRGELVALFHKYGMIEHESYEETGTHLRWHIPTNHSGPFAALLKV